MFDENEYLEVFSQVKASENLTRRVLNMKRENNYRSSRALPRLAVVIAILALMAVTVTASENVQNWFVSFFKLNQGGQITQEQVEYIEENVQPVHQVQVNDGWSVELHSMLRDDTTAYIIFRIQGPEDLDLSTWKDEDGNTIGQVKFGNSAGHGQKPDYFNFQDVIRYGAWGEAWLDDGDGLENTVNLMFYVEPSASVEDPFGPDKLFRFRFLDIVRCWTDLEYEQELRNGKYRGQDGVTYTEEEMRRLYQQETLAEGIWEFEIRFAESDGTSAEFLELLDQPVTTLASVVKDTGSGIADFETVQQLVTLKSVRLKNLSVAFTYDDCDETPNLVLRDGTSVKYPCVVMQDGTEIKLYPGGAAGGGVVPMYSESPIVFAQVNHIRMADGTIIPMPEFSK